MTTLLAALLIASAPGKQPIVSADPATCNARQAMQVTIGQLRRHADRWLGRCVSIDGLWTGRALFAELRDAQRPRAEWDDDSRSRRVGIYVPERLARLRGERPLSFRAVGVLLDCEGLWGRTDAVSGYCHNNASGPFLAVTDIRRTR